MNDIYNVLVSIGYGYSRAVMPIEVKHKMTHQLDIRERSIPNELSLKL
jgi:hypothetical protein